jgi:hypothetical protein
MVSVGDEAVSATRIREHLARGDVGRAADLLGRPYHVTGRLDDSANCLVRITPTLAVPAPGCYRASIGPFRPAEHRTTAIVAVRACGDGAHCVEVERPEGRLPDAVVPGRGVRVTFEGRA